MSATAKSFRPEDVCRETVREKRWLRGAEASGADTPMKRDSRCVGMTQPPAGVQDTVALLLLLARTEPEKEVCAWRVRGTCMASRLPLMKKERGSPRPSDATCSRVSHF